MSIVNIALWVAQALLVLAFLPAGVLKVGRSKDALAKGMPWTSAVPLPFVRFIGVAEILGAIGLIAPAATKIAPVLTPLAAGGLAVVMLGAITLHTSRKELGSVAGNAVILLLAAFIVVGRFVLAPIGG